MKSRDFTCIICPNGCDLHAEYQDDFSDIQVTGNICPKGAEYVRQELTAPMRTIASSVQVTGGILPLASVRLTRPIPKEHIFDAMKEIRALQVSAPVHSGDVLISNILGYDSDLIITKSIPAADPA